MAAAEQHTEEQQTAINPEDWANPPTLENIKQDFSDSKIHSDEQKAKISGWLDNLNLTGSAAIKKVRGYSSVQPRLIRKQAEWRYAAMSEPFLSTDDLYQITPVTWEDVEPARQNALVLNNQMNTQINKIHFVDSYVRAGVDEGTVIVKLGWERDTEEVEVERPIVVYTPNPNMQELHAELAQMRQENPTGYAAEVPEELKLAHDRSTELGVSMEATVTGYEMVTETKVKYNRPSVEVCNYKNITVDPSCGGDYKKAKFIVHTFDTSKAKLEEEGDRYFNLDQILVKENSPLSVPDHEAAGDTNFNFKDDPRKLFTVHEYWGYWDIDGTGALKPIVCSWVGNTIIRLEESPFPDGELPFVIVPMLPVKNSVYGEPDGELLKDNQNIIGAVTRGMIDVMGRSANGQMGSRKDALDATNRRRFEQGKDYQYNGGINPEQAFHMHTYPEIPASAQFMLQLQNVEAESMSGVKAFSTGINGDSLGDVATGIRGAIDAAGKRETGILRRLAAGMTEIGRKIISMNAEFLEDEEIIRITNENFVSIRRDDLAGEFDLRMDISTHEEDNVKAQELAFMLQTMGNNADPGMVKLILRDIARLRKMPELAKSIEDFEPQPDPLDVEIKQLEVQKLKAEILEIESRTRENHTDSELNMAKAREASSKADKTDLDFTEQESGVTQERNKELQGEQAKSNMMLETHKDNLLKKQDRGEQLDKYLSGK